ncbi:MAG TPA: hypothetical protein VMW66_02195 [Elusimicrobiales bacterium]|nr:hypothetical protein [Elusimicrobiales bacterium]
MDVLNTLVPPSQQISVLGKTRTIKPFTLKQTILLGRIVNEIKGKLDIDLKSQKSASALFLDILAKLGKEETVNLIEILLNTDLDESEKTMAENISLNELSEIIKAISKINDFKKVLGNFTTALETVNTGK